MGVSNSEEPDVVLAESIAREGCILRGVVGSTVHGLSNPGTDDRDEMGVCVEPIEYAMHALRIAHQGQELLRTGRITLPIAEPERSRLLEVRRGEVSLRDVLHRLHEQAERLEAATLASELPEQPDREAVDAFLAQAYQRVWAGELRPAT